MIFTYPGPRQYGSLLRTIQRCCRLYLDLEGKYVCLVVPSTRALHASWHVIAAGSHVVPVADGARFPNNVAVLVAPSFVEIPPEAHRQRIA